MTERNLLHLFSDLLRKEHSSVMHADFQLYFGFFTHANSHACFLQEAIAVGMEAVLTEDDAIITAYRAHGWTYTRGVPILGVLAELTGLLLNIIDFRLII